MKVQASMHVYNILNLCPRMRLRTKAPANNNSASAIYWKVPLILLILLRLLLVLLLLLLLLLLQYTLDVHYVHYIHHIESLAFCYTYTTCLPNPHLLFMELPQAPPRPPQVSWCPPKVFCRLPQVSWHLPQVSWFLPHGL